VELDRITVALRPRGTWEGIDLGFALARAWFPALWGLWWLSALPLAALALLLPGGQADWWALLVWWFKPLYEAPLVWWISRALFGERPPLRDAGRLLRAAWTRRLLPYLLWRRLAPRRSLVLTIGLLEGLGGTALRERRRVLGEGAGAAWLTLICAHFEAILWGGLLLGLFYLIPAGGLPGLDLTVALTDADAWPYWLSGGFYLFACSVIAPFYVCAGFALYIGRRTDLEAWDLELAFRRAGADASTGATAPGAARPGRRTASGNGRSAVLSGLLCAAVLAAWPGPPVGAAALPTPRPPPPLPAPAPARNLIAEVLADADFGRTRQESVWTYIGKDEETAAPDPTWLQGLGDVAVILGRLVKGLLVVLAVVAVALLIQRILRDWQPGAWRWRRRPTEPPPPAVPVALAADADPDAAELARAVRARLAAGDPRGALALLYRGSIGHLRRRGLRIPDGATEGECLRLAAGHPGTGDLEPLRRLTRDWQALAYAQQTPDPGLIAARLRDWLSWTGHGSPDAVATPAAGTQGHAGDAADGR